MGEKHKGRAKMRDQEENKLLIYRVDNLEKIVEKVSDATESIAKSMVALTRLEERHRETSMALERAFTAIERQGGRIGALEGEMPTLKLTRGWVITGVMGVMGILGVAIVALVLK